MAVQQRNPLSGARKSKKAKRAKSSSWFGVICFFLLLAFYLLIIAENVMTFGSISGMGDADDYVALLMIDPVFLFVTILLFWSYWSYFRSTRGFNHIFGSLHRHNWAGLATKYSIEFVKKDRQYKTINGRRVLRSLFVSITNPDFDPANCQKIQEDFAKLYPETIHYDWDWHKAKDGAYDFVEIRTQSLAKISRMYDDF